MSSDLRPCPFCSSSDLVIAAVADDDRVIRAVLCPECGASGPRATERDPPGHVEHLWNQRFGGDQ